MDEALYSLGDVARASGVDIEGLKNWIKRGTIRLDRAAGDRPGRGTGHRSLFTLRRALQVSVAAHMVRETGVSASVAAQAAHLWSDVGDKSRAAGSVAKNRWTLIVFGGSEPPSVKELGLKAPITDLFGSRRGIVAVVINGVVADTRAALEGVPGGGPGSVLVKATNRALGKGKSSGKAES